ncbi:MAG: hypothetical protein IT379_07890 [Deltaproteobacteria bacterium]|nr:hypothetical protein [Deltaproteobacteria bacterium]
MPLVLALAVAPACRADGSGHEARIDEARSAVAMRECMIAAVEGGLSDRHAEDWARTCAAACPMHGVAAIRACVAEQSRRLAPPIP